MKRVILSSLIIIAFCLASHANEIVSTGKTHSAFGDYKIEKSEALITLNGRELEAFTVSYNNSNLRATIAIDKNRKCKKYYVLSDDLSIQYECNKDYFGIAKLDMGLEKDGWMPNESALNKTEYFHQKVLTGGNNSDLDNIRVIASFFPKLLNNMEG